MDFWKIFSFFVAYVHMCKWANGQMGKWANGHMCKWANGQMGKCASVHMCICANGQVCICAYVHMFKWAIVHMSKWAKLYCVGVILKNRLKLQTVFGDFLLNGTFLEALVTRKMTARTVST